MKLLQGGNQPAPVTPRPTGTALLFVIDPTAASQLRLGHPTPPGHLEEVPMLPGMFAGTCCGQVFATGREDAGLDRVAWLDHQRGWHPRREAPGSSRWVFRQVPRKLDKVEAAWLGHTVTRGTFPETFYVWAIAPGERLWLIDNLTGRLLDQPVSTYECLHVSPGVLYPRTDNNELEEDE